MEGLNTDGTIKNLNIRSLLNTGSPSNKTAAPSSSADPTQAVLNTNLTGISELTAKAAHSSPDIRKDAILRAQTLINDPQWLSDENLDLLANKISEQETI